MNIRDTIRINTINECIDALEKYKNEPMIDKYVIDECIDVLKELYWSDEE